MHYENKSENNVKQWTSNGLVNPWASYLIERAGLDGVCYVKQESLHWSQSAQLQVCQSLLADLSPNKFFFGSRTAKHPPGETCCSVSHLTCQDLLKTVITEQHVQQDSDYFGSLRFGENQEKNRKKRIDLLKIEFWCKTGVLLQRNRLTETKQQQVGTGHKTHDGWNLSLLFEK